MNQRFATLPLWALLLLALLGTPGGSADPDDPEPRVADLMTAKLIHAKHVLEALALEDFPRLQQNAQQLELLSRDSGWQVLQTQVYRECSQDFRRASELIAESARQQNLDGASLGYVQLTLTCIECHKHMRQHRGN